MTRLGFRISYRWVCCCFLLVALQLATAGEFRADSDHDGLSDALEQKLLFQFMPRFMIGEHDCSIRPAEFKAGSLLPEAEADNGTIYGQASPAKAAGHDAPAVELHYYHLWRKDCGPHGHSLDTEHVAALIQRSNASIGLAKWQAIYWYAGAHENTVCDVSQIARASTLDSEDHGATVWISPGKHASYLSDALCRGGCGADHCVNMTKFVPAKVINLGEPGFPMNGSIFIASKTWPLEYKMSNSNFPAAAIARLNELPDTDIGRFNPGRDPVQGIIAKSNSTERALADSEANTTTAVGVVGKSTDDALSGAGNSTGAALSGANAATGEAFQKSYKRTGHALGTSIRHVGAALHVTR
jgi:hypothetical protein